MEEIVKCQKCGRTSPKGSKFCGGCGGTLEGGKIECPKCNKMNDSASIFCAECGSTIHREQQTDIENSLWRRAPDEFAVRIEAGRTIGNDLAGIFKKGINVENGTVALFFVDGALKEKLHPGHHTIETVSDQLRKIISTQHTAAVVLVDSGALELDFTVNEIYTKDPLKLKVMCKTVLQLADPTIFFVNVLKGRDSYRINELKDLILSELKNALNECVGDKSVEELSTNLVLKKSFQAKLEGHFLQTFNMFGLSFKQVRAIDFIHEKIDELKGKMEEVYLLVSEEEAKLSNRKRLFDVYAKDEIQDITEKKVGVSLYNERAKVWEEMRKAVSSDKMNEIKSEDELEAFLQEMNKGKLIRDEEIYELKRTYAENREDHDRARQFLQSRMDLEKTIDLERVRLTGRGDLETEEIEIELKKKRVVYEAQIAEERAKLATVREERIKNEMAELDLKKSSAKTDAEIRAIEREEDRLDGEMGLALLEKTQAIKAKKEREEMLLELEKEERLLKLEIQKKDAEHKRKMEEVEKFSNASAEALIMMSQTDPNKAAELLADLKKTDTLKGMTEDQILAMAAGGSPELAKAFAEKFKAQSSNIEEVKDLYKKMFDEQKESSKGFSGQLQEMFNKALETQRDVSVTASQRPDIVIPGMGGYGLGGMGGIGGEMLSCPNCRNRVMAGLRFCGYCGFELFKSGGPNGLQGSGPSGGGESGDNRSNGPKEPPPPGGGGARAQASENTSSNKCPNCNIEVAIGVKFCTGCGHKM